MLGMHVASAARRATRPTTPSSNGSRCSARLDRATTGRSRRCRGRRRAHRHLGVDGPGGREGGTRLQAFEGFTVDEALMACAAPDAVFMHCLPAYRGLEVTGQVIDGPQSGVFQQGHNRLHAARGVLAFLVGVP